MLDSDRAMRVWLVDEPSYLAPVAIGDSIRASGVGQVVLSDNAALQVSTLVQGLRDWQEYSIGDPLRFVPPTALPAGTLPIRALSAFGSTSLNAHFGLLDVGQPQAGETRRGRGNWLGCRAARPTNKGAALLAASVQRQQCRQATAEIA